MKSEKIKVTMNDATLGFLSLERLGVGDCVKVKETIFMRSVVIKREKFYARMILLALVSVVNFAAAQKTNKPFITAFHSVTMM